MLSDDVVVVGAVSDDPLASDIAERMGQELDISDILAFIKSKTFGVSRMGFTFHHCHWLT